MAAPLSQELRRRPVQAVETGSSGREAVRRFAVSESAAITLVRRITLAEIKALLHATAARTRKALWTTVGQPLDRFGPDERRNYLANSGHESA